MLTSRRVEIIVHSILRDMRALKNGWEVLCEWGRCLAHTLDRPIVCKPHGSFSHRRTSRCFPLSSVGISPISGSSFFRCRDSGREVSALPCPFRSLLPLPCYSWDWNTSKSGYFGPWYEIPTLGLTGPCVGKANNSLCDSKQVLPTLPLCPARKLVQGSHFLRNFWKRFLERPASSRGSC